MNLKEKKLFFALLRSAIFGGELDGRARASLVGESSLAGAGESRGAAFAKRVGELARLASKHDVAHLLAFGLKKNRLLGGVESGVNAGSGRAEKQSADVSSGVESEEKQIVDASGGADSSEKRAADASGVTVGLEKQAADKSSGAESAGKQAADVSDVAAAERLLSISHGAEKSILTAIYRYQRLNYEYERTLLVLAEEKIAFMPLKGSVMRRYYPEAWMRTSCDADILVHKEDLDRAVAALEERLSYVAAERGTHDIALDTPNGSHIELHFDLIEEGRANEAIEILSKVWENATPSPTCAYFYEMSDAFFYLYHVAHMAKHFETGGCGIRPFIDLMILDRLPSADREGRDKLLSEAGLLKFAEAARRLSELWLGEGDADELTVSLEEFILSGGVYGTTQNRVAIQQKKRGGRFGYLISRIFVPTSKLKRYYPVLERHPWLMPFMQVRRWFMLLRPDVRKMARAELQTNTSLDGDVAKNMKAFLADIGLE